jgi:fucose 4-O-acetylase-like acetyltransferase
MNVLFWGIHKVCRKKPILILFASLLVGWVGYACMPHMPCYLGTAVTAIPFFMLGYMLRHCTSLLEPNRLDPWNHLLAVGGVFLMMLCLPEIFTSQIPYVSYGWNLYDMDALRLYLVGTLGILVVLFISKKMNDVPFISYIGRYSIIILGTHQLVHLLLLNKIWDYFPENTIFIFLKFVFCVLISALCIPFCRKVLPYFFAQKDLIKLNK